ncbi:MAG: glycosyltransferase family 2 protein [Deinococcota bacterium]|nr:glycosyltransferase family 2 protein [Deinococcota bacterium]
MPAPWGNAKQPLQPPLVYIVILNWNGWRDTVECLASLNGLSYRNYRVVVVDNASSDGSVARIRAAYPELTLLESERNGGFAAGNNLGLRHALAHAADYVWLLNNDTTVDPEALTYLVKRLREEPAAGMCGSKLHYYHDPDKLQALGGASYNKWFGTAKHLGQHQGAKEPVDLKRLERSMDYVVGASLLVSRAFLEDVGLLSEDYFLYFEEIDWATRAKPRYRPALAEGSSVYHKEGASIGSSSGTPTEKSLLADYYSLKNRLVFTRKFYPEALPTVYLGLLVAAFNRMRRRQWDRVWMIAGIALGKDVLGQDAKAKP